MDERKKKKSGEYFRESSVWDLFVLALNKRERLAHNYMFVSNVSVECITVCSFQS